MADNVIKTQKTARNAQIISTVILVVVAAITAVFLIVHYIRKDNEYNRTQNQNALFCVINLAYKNPKPTQAEVNRCNK